MDPKSLQLAARRNLISKVMADDIDLLFSVRRPAIGTLCKGLQKPVGSQSSDRDISDEELVQADSYDTTLQFQST